MSSGIMPGACRTQAPDGRALATLHVFDMVYLLQFILTTIMLSDCVATNTYTHCQSGTISVLTENFFLAEADKKVFIRVTTRDIATKA